MEHRVLLGGSGGQGVMLLGTMLSIAAIHEKKHTTCMPAYGPEMRGGTANCTCIISEEEIETRLPDEVTAVIVMNEPSYKKFVGDVPENGLLIVNSSITAGVATDVPYEVIQIPCNDIAAELGDVRAANMVAAGAYIQKTNVVGVAAVEATLQEYFGTKKPAAVKLNVAAIEAGMKFVAGL